MSATLKRNGIVVGVDGRPLLTPLSLGQRAMRLCGMFR